MTKLVAKTRDAGASLYSGIKKNLASWTLNLDRTFSTEHSPAKAVGKNPEKMKPQAQ